MIDFNKNYIYLDTGIKALFRTELNTDNLIQCTGLKDINGKLIYEGDIIKTKAHNLCYNNELFEIMFSKIYAQFLAYGNGKCIDLTDTFGTEIIGNIYEIRSF